MAPSASSIALTGMPIGCAMAEYVVENLGDPDGVLVVDETGVLEKGEMSVGVQRQSRRSSIGPDHADTATAGAGLAVDELRSLSPRTK